MALKSQSYSGDPKKQRRAAARILEAIHTLERLIADLEAGYIPYQDWMGKDDRYAKMMRDQEIFPKVIAALKAVLATLKMAYEKSMELAEEIQEPQRNAVEELQNIHRQTGQLEPAGGDTNQGAKRNS
ncbi:hypothetical protein [Streptomyces zaomyceticus]|uniref:hypothetical protein n=1 Tax=Streptomyces zaomyceticus TaxID=68286 RepID=UPI0036BBF3DE